MKLLKLIFTLLTFLCLGCSIPAQNFSYSTKTYSNEKNIKTDITNHGNYISFPPYLFEFNIRVHRYDTILPNTGQPTYSFTFDTASIYVIDATKKLFFEFNSFQTNANIISSGQLQDKKFGVSFKENAAIEADTGFKKDCCGTPWFLGKNYLITRRLKKM